MQSRCASLMTIMTSTSKPISVEIGGRTYNGEYRVGVGHITVEVLGATATEQTDGPAETQARRMLRRLSNLSPTSLTATPFPAPQSCAA